MSQIYFFMAVVGGILLVIQFVMLLVGLGHFEMDADVDFADGDGGFAGGELELDPHADGHGVATFGQISFRTLVAFATFFGLGGMWAESRGSSAPITSLTALAGGLLAFYLVGFVMRKFAQFSSSGNIDIQNAVGERGRIYIPIPAARGGAGKVTLTVQERTVQIKAVTDGDALKTGALCEITGVHDQETLIVSPVEEEGNIHA